MSIIKHIIDRDCHIRESNRSVIKHVISKLKEGYTTYSQLPKSDRRYIMVECIKCHRENRELYGYVMSGIK